MKKTKTLTAFALIFALILTCLLAGCKTKPKNQFEPFYRFDMDSPTAWQEPLGNTRFLTKDAYTLKPLGEEKCKTYGLDPAYMPSEDGMDTLNISGSAEFSENQFAQLVTDIKALAGEKKIYVVDCRLEAHALLNGISISWYGDHNWAYKGMTLSEAEADEVTRFGTLIGKTITAYAVEENARGASGQIAVREWKTERELVENAGLGYLRLPCNDHSWPEPEAIDKFIAFVKGIDKDNVWLHFHCQAGKSRTGIFMAIYDMIKNPDVSYDDIMLRHAMTGSSYFPYADSTSDIADVYIKRAKGIKLIYDYVHENQATDFATPWSQWSADRW
ncbi:MAG: tyrosine-protein phosphatase [Clostridia bacterium]|nr:tyrosine-protein phosphatase [Clostridia bacterium]